MARVLVIEDEPSISQLLRIVLEHRGHEVLVADDGSRGLATATRRSPDAIILDVMMPFMDGFAVLEALREDDRSVVDPRDDAVGDPEGSCGRALLWHGRPGVRSEAFRPRHAPRDA